MIRTGPPHSDTVDTRPVSDLCTCCCATSKDVSQQVVVWAQTRDRAAAMLAHVVVSIGKLDAIPTDRRCDRTWSWHHHRRRRPVLGSSAARTQVALWSRASLAMVGLFVGGTQWVVLSAADEHPWCGASHAGPGRGVDGADGAIQPLVKIQYVSTTHTTSPYRTSLRSNSEFVAELPFDLLTSSASLRFVVWDDAASPAAHLGEGVGERPRDVGAADHRELLDPFARLLARAGIHPDRARIAMLRMERIVKGQQAEVVACGQLRQRQIQPALGLGQGSTRHRTRNIDQKRGLGPLSALSRPVVRFRGTQD